MPVVQVDLRQAGEGGGGYAVVTPGFYQLQCVTSKHQKARDGQSMVVFTEWRIKGPQHVGAKLLKVFSLKPTATWSFRNCLQAVTGKEIKGGQVIKIDTDQLLNKEVGAYVADGEMVSRGQKRKVSEITEWLTLADFANIAKTAVNRTSIPSTQQAMTEAASLDGEVEEFEYEDPEDEEGEVVEGADVEEVIL
jgi:hypothetical protein